MNGDFDGLGVMTAMRSVADFSAVSD